MYKMHRISILVLLLLSPDIRGLFKQWSVFTSRELTGFSVRAGGGQSISIQRSINMEAATNQNLSPRRPWGNKPSYVFLWPSLKLIWKLLHRYTCCHHPFTWLQTHDEVKQAIPPPPHTHTHTHRQRFEPLNCHHYNISVTSVYHAQSEQVMRLSDSADARAQKRTLSWGGCRWKTQEKLSRDNTNILIKIRGM